MPTSVERYLRGPVVLARMIEIIINFLEHPSWETRLSVHYEAREVDRLRIDGKRSAGHVDATLDGLLAGDRECWLFLLQGIVGSGKRRVSEEERRVQALLKASCPLNRVWPLWNRYYWNKKNAAA